MDETTTDQFKVNSEKDLKSLEKYLKSRQYDYTTTVTVVSKQTRTVILLHGEERVGVVVVPNEALTGEVAFGKLTELIFIHKDRSR